jgi:putative transposase
MREKGWLCRPRKKNWVCTTDTNHKLPVYPNLIKDLSITGTNQQWVAVITYTHILVCFIHLAVILDLFSRKMIGYGILRSIDTQLTLSALRMAIADRNPPSGCVHHSDRGVHYASAAYVKELEFFGIQISMSRK